MVVCGSLWLVRDPNETPSMRACRGRDMMSDEWTPGDAISEARSCVIRLPLTYIQTRGQLPRWEEQIISVRIVPGSIRRAGCVVDVGAIIEYDDSGLLIHGGIVSEGARI